MIFEFEFLYLRQPFLVQWVSESVPDVDELDHDDGVCDEKLLDQRGCFDFGMGHQKDQNDFELIHEWEEIEQLLHLM